MRQICLALDLRDDPQAIAEYDEYHRRVWPEVIQSLYDSGIDEMEIYRIGNRLFMIIRVQPDFTLSRKAEMDLANPVVQKWEATMSAFQQPLPWAEPGQKWMLLERVFHTKKEN